MGAIYKITNVITGQFYIGSSINPNGRRRTHFSKLRHRKHDNSHLQNSFNEHGESAFIFEILEDSISPEKLEERELSYLRMLKPQYNKSTCCVTTKGVPLSEDHKRKISLANRGKGRIDQRTPEQKACAIERSKLVTKGLAFKRKMADVTKNYYSLLTPEERKLRNQYKIGRKFSIETRKKLSEKAKIRSWDEATKKKISETLKQRNLNKKAVLTNGF